ncbi:hypothetical protein ACFSTC_50525 [Nonomuraea ferruginea]
MDTRLTRAEPSFARAGNSPSVMSRSCTMTPPVSASRGIATSISSRHVCWRSSVLPMRLLASLRKASRSWDVADALRRRPARLRGSLMTKYGFTGAPLQPIRDFVY